MDARREEGCLEIFKVEVTIDYASGADKKRNGAISYVVDGRRPPGDNRSVLLYDSINIYAPINGLLAFRGAEIVMLSRHGQFYCANPDGSRVRNSR